jgi:hypothetical protein
MTAPARMRLVGAVVSAGHLALALAGELVLGVPGAWLLFGLCALLSLVLSLLAAPLLAPRRPPGGDDGGAPSGGDDTPPDPPWWPDFERGFRAYEQRRRTRA